jgi:mono/diheme cytochrome c family protein
MQVLDFLQSQQYLQLGWCADKEIRNTGPFKDGVSYGTHPAVKVYYSPNYMRWLAGGREGSPPDGSMVIKSQLPPPAERYSSSSPTPQDWTVMIKDSKSTRDGWFWGEWYVGMTFDNDQYPFNYPNAGYALYCLRCHSSAQNEYTFGSLSNIEGFPGTPLTYPVDDSWQALLGSGFHGPSPPSGATLLAPAPASQEFLKTYTAISDVPAAKVQNLPSETYDRVFSSPHGPEQFLTSDQCMSCHSGLNGPFGPIMFLPTGPYTNGAYPGYNISPYGEWRWSPMGLAGRDPVFYAQMDSELTFAKTQPDNPSQLIVNTCMSCHGVMGDRQIDIDQPTNQNFSLDYVTLPT